MKYLTTLATLLTMAVLLTAAAALLGSGVPAAVHYIDHDKVTATMVKGGSIVDDPGLIVLANRRGTERAKWNTMSIPTTSSSWSKAKPRS